MEFGQGLKDHVTEAVKELHRLDEELHRLARRRDELYRFIEASQPLLEGEAEAFRVPPLAPTFDRVPPPVSRSDEAQLSQEDTLRLKADRRRYLRMLSDVSLEILRKTGRPMTSHEIYERHPEKHHVSQEQLYQTLYKRQYQKFDFLFADGYFWLISEGWPLGWEPRKPAATEPR